MTIFFNHPNVVKAKQETRNDKEETFICILAAYI